MKANLEIENEVRDVVSRLISQVSISAKQGRTDINLVSEDVWIPILKEIFHAPKLVNLNLHQKNFPGIDLGDTENRICFQVTATTDIEKIKATVTKFIDNKYFNSFDDLYMFILVKRQKTYTQTPISKIIGKSGFKFSTKEHVIDPETIAEKISHLRLPTQKRLLNELKAAAGDISSRIQSANSEENVPYVFASNLVPVVFSEKVYSARVDFDKDSVWDVAKQMLGKMPRKKTTRSCIYLSLELAGYTNAAFVYHEKKIFTFENLEKNSAFSGLIDEGTIESIDTEELYSSQHIEYENIFKQLLKSNLELVLNERNIGYLYKDKIFYFLPSKKTEAVRKVTWKEKRKATRTVYENIPSSKDESEIYANRHLAFDITFTRIDKEWYGVIYPSWIFTNTNGYKHFDSKNLVSSKKGFEKNHSVRDHVRFICSFLNETTQSNEIISFGKLVELQIEHEEIVDLDAETK